MKSSKDENEVATWKYAFVARGAIGKGRGRGLKSVLSLGVSRTDIPLSPSTDQVVAKGRGRSLRSISNAQGVRATNQNHLVVGKGRIPSFSSTDELMQYIKTNSASAQGESRELRSMYSFEESKNEEQSFHQNARYASQSMSIPSKGKISNSTISSAQGLRTMDKRSLAHENEHMQTDVPISLSTDDVMQSTQTFETSVSQGLRTTDKASLVHEKESIQTDIPISPIDQVKLSIQTVETSSCTIVKDKKVRGSNKCKEVASLDIGQKLKVTFYNNRTVGNNSNLFSRHLGKIVRDCNICPLGVSSWKHIKEEKLNHMWAIVKDKFESDDMDSHRDHILGWMKELWNKWRGQLYTNYVKGKPIQEALKNMPKGVDKKQWKWLVKEHFTSKGFQARSNKNAINRAKLKMLHHIGSKPIREIIYQKGGKDGNPPDLATIFYETRKKNNTLVDSEAIEKHAQIQELVQSEPSLPSIEIVEKCFEPQSRSHVFDFGGGVKAKDLKGGTSSKAELLSKLHSTQNENQSLKDCMSNFANEMKELRQLKYFFLALHPEFQPPVQEIDHSDP